MFTAMILKLPRWAQWVALALFAVWAIGAVVSVVAGSFAMADAVAQLARLHVRAAALQGCQIALRDKSAYWPRRADGLCHIEDLKAASAASN